MRSQVVSLDAKLQREVLARKRAEEEANLLQAMIPAITEAKDLQEALQFSLVQVCLFTRWVYAEAWIPDPQNHVLVRSAVWHQERPELEEWARLCGRFRYPPGKGLPGCVWLLKQPVWVNDLAKGKEDELSTLSKRMGIRTAVSIPVIASQEVVAVIAFYMFESHEEDERFVRLITAIASQLGALFQRKRVEEQLLNKTEELVRSNRDLDQFAYSVSHDLQEPLRKIIAFGDRLKGVAVGRLDEKERDYLERMQGAAARMKDLIDDLLRLSRISTSAQPFEPVELRRIVCEVLSDLEIRIYQSGGEVEVGDLPTVRADPAQMRQLFQNLIANALKFSREGQVPQVSVTGRTLDDGWAEITVHDDGIGFDERHWDRILQPFQRLHTREEYEGSGIGLAICHKIVTRHGGRFSAKSAPGSGSTFFICLPPHSDPTETSKEPLP